MKYGISLAPVIPNLIRNLTDIKKILNPRVLGARQVQDDH